jgi:hypothetical protein
MTGDSRWIVEIDYRTDHGPVTVDYHIEEFTELAWLVEAGPDWNTILQVRVELNPIRRSHSDTVEASRLR